MKSTLINDAQDKISETGLPNGSKLLSKNGLLIVVRGMILAHTLLIAITEREVAFNQDIKGLVCSDEFRVKYIFQFLQSKSKSLLNSIDETTHGTKKLSTNTLLNLEIPKISLTEQDQFIEKIDKIDESIQKAKSDIEILKTLQNSLLNQIFTP